MLCFNIVCTSVQGGQGANFNTYERNYSFMFLDFAVNRHHITAEQIAMAKKKPPALREEGLLPRQDYSQIAKSTVNSALNLKPNIFGLLLFYHPMLFIIFICCVTKLALYLLLLSSSAGERRIRTAWGQSKPWTINTSSVHLPGAGWVVVCILCSCSGC